MITMIFRAWKSTTSTTTSVLKEIRNDLLAKRHSLLRLIDSKTGKLSEPQRSDAILAQKPDNYDLILVDGRQEPPIVRFQSHSELFKIAQKREEAATRARLANKLKEMHFTTVTGEHDFTVKLGRIDEWIRKGWRVKIVIEEKRKRRNALNQIADAKKEMMNQIISKLAGTAEIVSAPELEGGCLVFSLHANQKIISQIKQERSNQK